MLSLRAIEPHTLELLRKLSANPLLASARLVGGTSLALQYGHRKSIDLDFFSSYPFEQSALIESLRQLGQLEILNRTNNILQVKLDGVLLDFVDYHCYGWIDDKVIEEGISLASPIDIAAMKINAVIGRGTRKDFVDLYVLLSHYSIHEIMSFYHKKYPDYSEYQALKSLTYFEDAESFPMPVMLIDDDWNKMKRTIIQAAKDYQANQV